ncbi:hypothetical protein, partial [Streptomyces sp. NPDC058964]|uniref:hypothetical protein n=1 Tax=Streptomyces sp. NPDC058964 TaxID=3346681 RepID=UPI003696C771
MKRTGLHPHVRVQGDGHEARQSGRWILLVKTVRKTGLNQAIMITKACPVTILESGVAWAAA